MEPARNVEMTVLLDFYGALLTKKQYEMIRLRLEEDLSLAEIAESFDVSRQAVHDALRKAEKTLISMEDKLHLVEKYRALHASVHRATDALDRSDIELAKSILSDMQREGAYGI